MQSSEVSYVAWLKDPDTKSGLEDLTAEELHPVWLEARESLCPVDDEGPITGRPGDLEIA